MSYYEHNKRVLLRARPGDLLAIDRCLYKHWVVYIGNGRVIHFTGGFKNFLLSSSPASIDQCLHGDEAVIREEDFWDVVDETNKVEIKNLYDDQENELNSEDEIVRRARSRLNERRYDLVFNNCEHFANWCRYGRHKSQQVENGAWAIFGILAFGAAIVLGASIFKEKQRKN